MHNANVSEYIRDALTKKLKAIDASSAAALAATPIPHIATFHGFAHTLARTYRPNDEALKQSWDNARHMKNDLAVMECIEMRRRSVALLEWHIKPEDAKDARLVEAAGIVEKILRRTPRFVQLRDCLLYAIWYGKYGAQTQWARTFVNAKPYYYVRNWIPINGDKIVFKVLEGTPFENERVGVRVGFGAPLRVQGAQERLAPTERGLAYFFNSEQRDRIIVHRHMIEDGDYDDPYSGGNIVGVGIRSRIYWTWYLMKETLAWIMEYIERSATGFEIWYYPSGNEEARKKIAEAAENRVGHSGNIILVPQMEGSGGRPMYEVKRIEPSMAGADVCIGVVKEFFQHQIKRYILGQTLTTEQGSTGLGSNLASVHLETYLQILKYDAGNLAETLTRDLVEPLRKYNFPWLDEHSLRFEIETEEVDRGERLNSIRSAWEIGARISEADVLQAAGLSLPTSGDKVLLNPAMSWQENQHAQQATGAAFGEDIPEEIINDDKENGESGNGRGKASSDGFDDQPEKNP